MGHKRYVKNVIQFGPNKRKDRKRMENIRIEKFPQYSNKTNKYQKILEGICFENGKKLERPKEMVVLEKKGYLRRLRHSRWKFKACPRCHGDLNSCYGEDFTCFQCGYICYSWVRKEEDFKGGYHGKTKES